VAEYARVRDLATRMREVAAQRDPVTLPILLGSECATAAGVPSDSQIARELITRLATSSSMTKSAQPRRPSGTPPPPGASDDVVLGWFQSYLGSLGPAQRYKVLEPHYRAVPVPTFYHDLANLVAAGWVTHVLTTNVDSLFEQALDRAGLRYGADYEVIVVGAPYAERKGAEPRLRLVKLHGDLGLTQLPAGPDEIERVLSEQRSVFRGQLLDELIVVGHQLGGGTPVDDWLWRTSGRELWWALPSVPDPAGPLSALADIRPVRLLAGPNRGTPASLFARLAFLLLQVPALEVLDLLSADAPDDLALEQAFQHSELLKSRAMTHDLQEQLVPGVRDPAVDAELRAQQYERVGAGQLPSGTMASTAPVNEPQQILANAVDSIIRETSQDPNNTLAEFLKVQCRLMLDQAQTQPVASPIMRVAADGVLALTDAMGPDLSPTTQALIREAATIWGGTAGSGILR
jgi:hypothetical protein